MGNLITSKGAAEQQRRRIMIVDDHPIVRLGLAQLINREPDLEVCGEADGVVEALRQMERSHPDVVIIDISLDGEDGIELIEHAKARWAEMKILVSSAHDERTFAGRVLRAGAMGYIPKHEPMPKIIEAIRKVLRGEVYLSPEMMTVFLQRAAVGKTLDGDPVASLTDRELQVFENDRPGYDYGRNRPQAPAQPQDGRIAPQGDQGEAESRQRRLAQPSGVPMGRRRITDPAGAGPGPGSGGQALLPAARRLRRLRPVRRSCLFLPRCRRPLRRAPRPDRAPFP